MKKVVSKLVGTALLVGTGVVLMTGQSEARTIQASPAYHRLTNCSELAGSAPLKSLLQVDGRALNAVYGTSAANSATSDIHSIFSSSQLELSQKFPSSTLVATGTPAEIYDRLSRIIHSRPNEPVAWFTLTLAPGLTQLYLNPENRCA